MYPFGDGGFVVDTPGLRDVGLWGIEPGEVGAAFPEILRAAQRCRFDDCRHLKEPECALPAAVVNEEVAAERLESYRTLLREAALAARPWLGRE